MIRVLIAEDEPPVMRRLARLIEQLDPAFCVAVAAQDGEKALEAMRDSPCDVVFTDIRMPVMDGLALMEALRREYPDCMVAVLSGYSDFEYLTKAIRSRAMDYLLKPVDPGELGALLKKMKDHYFRLEHERLAARLSAQINRPEVQAAGREPEDARLGVCLFCAGAMPLSDDAEMLPGGDAWNALSLEGLAQDLVPGYASFTWEFMGDTPAERILLFSATDEGALDWVRCLHEEALSRIALPVSCAFLRESVPLAQTGRVIRRLRKILHGRMQIGRGLFLPVNARELDARDASAEDDTPLARALAESLSGGEAAGRRALFARFERERWTQKRIAALLDQAAGILEANPRYSQYRAVMLDAVNGALSLKELENSLESLAPAQSLNRGEQRGVVRRIEAYLRENYAAHITNQTLSAEFGYVPSYISILFRQEYGMSPSDYLTRLRVEEAKRLMQRHPDMRIRDIAERVGFKSQPHFSRVFKKYEGTWPTGYQPGAREEDAP